MSKLLKEDELRYVATLLVKEVHDKHRHGCE